MAEIQDIRSLSIKIDKGELPQSCLIFGEETFFIDKLLEKIDLLARKKSFVISKISSADFNLNDLLELVEQNSLFGSSKILVVKEFGKFIKSGASKETDDEEDLKPSKSSGLVKLLIDYLKNPNPSTYLFLIHPDRIDMRLKFYKEASKLIPFYQAKRIYEKEIFDFIQQKFTERKIQVDYQTIEYIYKTVGNNLYDIESELNRLFISIEGLKRIDLETIKKFIIPIRKYSIFDLLNAFRDKDISNALEVGLNLINNNLPLVYIISMLQKYFFSLLTFNEVRNQYKSDEKVAAVMGCHPYFLKDYELASKRYRFEELEKIFDILLNKDIELKSLNLKDDVLYISMVSEIGLVIRKL